MGLSRTGLLFEPLPQIENVQVQQHMVDWKQNGGASAKKNQLFALVDLATIEND